MSSASQSQLLTEEPGFTNIWDMQPTGREATSLAIAMMILAFLSVVVRFMARVKAKARWGIEDVLIILALLCFFGYCAVFIRGMQTSGGTLNILQFLPLGVENFYKYLYGTEILFTITITLVKLSILFFYTTVFSTPGFRRTAYLTMGLSGAWFFVFFFLVIFQCSPVYAFWQLELVAEGKGTCIPLGKILTAYETTNIIIDAVILSLPVFMIKTLQLPTPRKIALIGIFLLGSLVIITCIVRISYLANVVNSDNSNTLANGLNWSTVELAIAIVCACAPTYGPLFRSLNQVPSSVRSWVGSRTHPTTGASTNVKSGKNSALDSQASRYNKLSEPGDEVEHLTHIQGGKTNSRSEEYPMDAIRVHRSVEVV